MRRTLHNRSDKFHLYLSIAIKSLLVIFGIIGVCSTTIGSGGFMSGASLLYFTVQSNITIMAFCFVLLVFDIMRLFGKNVELPAWVTSIKFVFTVAIALTFLVFLTMLMPPMIAAGRSAYLSSLSNIMCHNLVPLLAIADWLLFDCNYKTKKTTFLFGTAMPLYYLAFSLICSFSGVLFGEGKIVPYFFLDYEANGWFTIGGGKLGVFYWIVIMILIVLLLSWFLIFVKNKVGKSKWANPMTEQIDEQMMEDERN